MDWNIQFRNSLSTSCLKSPKTRFCLSVLSHGMIRHIWRGLQIREFNTHSHNTLVWQLYGLRSSCPIPSLFLPRPCHFSLPPQLCLKRRVHKLWCKSGTERSRQKKITFFFFFFELFLHNELCTRRWKRLFPMGIIQFPDTAVSLPQYEAETKIIHWLIWDCSCV